MICECPVIHWTDVNTAAPSAVHQCECAVEFRVEGLRRSVECFFLFCGFEIKNQNVMIRFLCTPVLSVVQRMDSVTEGIQRYGGKINAVETDLKKLGI